MRKRINKKQSNVFKLRQILGIPTKKRKPVLRSSAKNRYRLSDGTIVEI